MPKRMMRAVAYCFLAVLLLVPAACSDSPGTPELAPSAAPTAAKTPEHFSIAFTASNYTDSAWAAYIANTTVCMGRLQKLLNDKGWKVRLQLKLIDYADDAVAAEERLIRAEIATGSACDGYLILSDAATSLHNAGLAIDPADTVRSEAPALYARYKRYFDGGAAGLPAYVRTRTANYSVALFLPKEISDAAGIETLGDALGWLEKTDSKRKISSYFDDRYTLQGLMKAWAGEQGYYPLALYGMTGGMYAAYGDRSCTPVPLEDIDEFQTFTDRCAALIAGGRIVDYLQTPVPGQEPACGYIGLITADMDEQFLLRHGRTGSDYVAYPLRGCAWLSRPPVDIGVYKVYAIPAASANTIQVAKLMEWLAADADGYALANYGEPDVDYRIVGGLIEPLCEGKPLTAEDWDYQTSKAFNVLAPTLYWEDIMARPTVYRVSNYAEASSVEVQHPPIWDIAALYESTYQSTAFDDIATDMQSTIQERTDLLAGLITDGSVPVMRDQYAKRLLAIRADTDELARRYAERIKELREEQKGD